ncbi:MAG TPA: hypothetical protein VF132_11040, partial [Rudaea sp.]
MHPSTWRRLSAGALLAFVSSITAAAGVSAPGDLRQVPLAPLAAQTKAASADVHPLHPGGRNQQVQPSSREKFLAEPERTGTDVYIVRLRDLPTATYDGRVRGFAATAEAMRKRSTAIHRTNASAAPLNAYRSYLLDRHQAVLDAARSKGINAAA